MIASDYPISFPYGATSAPYSDTHPHRGDDRACPTGTPVVINGVTIGLTGMTGEATGPHLHIQEWQGNYLNVRKPQNAFKGGAVTLTDPNQTVGDGSFGKFVDIKNDDGWTNSYCHLSEIKVTVGQVLQGGTPVSASQDAVDATAVKQAYNAGLLRDATQAEIDGRVGAKQTLQDMQSDILASKEHKAILEKVNNANPTPTVIVNGQEYIPK